MKLINALKEMGLNAVVSDGGTDWTVDNLIDNLDDDDRNKEVYSDGIAISAIDQYGYMESPPMYRIVEG